jgi:predicted TIM-barrel fold metal-dependent hydrolase
MVAERILEILRGAPHLRIIVAHLGRNTPNTSEHVESNLRALRDAPNVCFETSTVRDPAIFKRAVEIVGEDRVIFGSDFPFDSFLDLDPLAVEIDCVRQAGLGAGIERKIFSENILRCLNS